MKLVIQIPCYNEAEQLEATLADLPQQIPGIDEIEVLVVDDGSIDGTALVAKKAGVKWLVRHRRNRGLAAAFGTGMDSALRLGADVIVNMDADGQYRGDQIEAIVAPLLAGKADMVIGDRRPGCNLSFSWYKRFLQRLGSRVMSHLAKTEIPDAVSGFRAFSREAALRLCVLSTFSYTIETVLQAANDGLAIVSVPITTRETKRPSRLFRNVPQFLWRSFLTMLNVQVMYRPLAFLLPPAIGISVLGALPIMRFLILFLHGKGDGHVQSLVLGGLLVVLGVLLFALASIAQLIAVNRKLAARQLYLIRREIYDRERGLERQPSFQVDDAFG